MSQDTAWKLILDKYLEDFFALCLPSLYQKIDWARSWSSLDNELHAITKGSLTGKRIVDKLIKVFLKSGEDVWILIHIEVQGKKDKHFSQRMYTYATRAMERYDRDIFSCAILTDEEVYWRPDFYERGFGGTKIRMDYKIIKIVDYRAQIEMLELSRNPFACVILAQLAKFEAKRKSPRERLNIKFATTRKLYEKGFSKEQIIDLYLFLDWLLHLPNELESEYHHQLCAFEETTNMPYITTAERIGRQKGREEGIVQGIQRGKEQGIAQGKAMMLVQILSYKFGPISPALREQLLQASDDQLLLWAEKIMAAPTLEEVFNSL